MSRIVAHMQKLKVGNLKGVQRHVDRLNQNYSNELIDSSKTTLNYELTEHLKSDDYQQDIQAHIQATRTAKKAVRKDAVLVNSWIISSDQEFFEGLSTDEQRRFFETNLTWFQSEFGKQNVRFATVHLDETTPHMHMGIVPLKDGKLSGKTVFNRQSLQRIQEQLPAYLNQQGFNIARGLENSGNKHLDERGYKEYQQLLADVVSEDREAQQDHLKEDYLDLIQELSPQAQLTQTEFDELENNWEQEDKIRFGFIKRYGGKPEPIETERGRNQFKDFFSWENLQKKTHAIVQTSLKWIHEKTALLKQKEDQLNQQEAALAENNKQLNQSWGTLLESIGYDPVVVEATKAFGHYKVYRKIKVATGRTEMHEMRDMYGNDFELELPVEEEKTVIKKILPSTLFQEALEYRDQFNISEKRRQAFLKSLQHQQNQLNQDKPDNPNRHQGRSR